MNQELTTKPPVQNQTLFSSSAPLFLFDAPPLIQSITDNTTVRGGELFHDSAILNTGTWNLDHQSHDHSNINQGLVPPPLATPFTSGIDTNYLPPLIENIENMVTIDHQVQSCSMDEEGEIALECLRRQELNEWVESQQCSNFLFWDINVEGSILGGSDHDHQQIDPAANSPSMGTNLSAFPSSL